MYRRKLCVAAISDVHLGTYGCHATELVRYLKSIDPEILVLNGDIIDMWEFRKRYFPADHLRVIKEIFRMGSKGTKVYYITGNHDDVLRRFSNLRLGPIQLKDKLVLQINQERTWIFHGDVFDMSIQVTPLLARIGSRSYNLLIRLNRMVNQVWNACNAPRSLWPARSNTRSHEPSTSSRILKTSPFAPRSKKDMTMCSVAIFTDRSCEKWKLSRARSPISIAATGWKTSPPWNMTGRLETSPFRSDRLHFQK
ncbi:MAG: UDP-2,3-diacylglucosamine diphosphatase [Saprospiraceae bacterium]|nr:UDP-2,3-diacylglucosamine diphosphatase [Saprospiraceae bacterium]